MENKQEGMTAEEKLDTAFEKVLTPKDAEGNDLKFQSQEAEDNYKKNINRVKAAIQLKQSDRVPVSLFPGWFPIYYSGMKPQDAMYDYEKCAAAFKKFVLDFKPDIHFGAVMPGPGRFYELVDYRLYAWPGHGVGPEHGYQCLEKEYMKAEEYDLLITDPSFYFRNFYLPRVFGALEPWSMLPPLTGILEMYGVAINFIPFAIPPVQETFTKLAEAGAEAMKWIGAIGGVDGELATMGYPDILGGFTKAPFDVLGDTLRGTKGIMMDIFKRPDKLLEAMDRLVPIMINMGLASFQQTGNPLIFIPLHKGADGFMSDEQFKTFYWPSLKKVMLGLIDGGCVPFPAAEGGYNSRLEVIRDLPRGKTLWMFDQTDLFRAKEIVGDTLCIFGNISSSMLNVSTPDEVKAYCKKLIDQVGKDGGFVLANGVFFDEAKAENVMAMVEFGKEYGGY